MATARVWAAAVCAAAVLAGSAAPVGAQSESGQPQQPGAGGAVGSSGAVASVPVLGDSFMLGGDWVASGVVWLDWDDVDDATGYEAMFRSADGWVLLSEDGPVGAVVTSLDGSSARVAGLPVGASEYWFAVRARNVRGVSG